MFMFLSFWRKYMLWLAFLHTTSSWCSKDSLTSITVPRYLYCWTDSTAWSLMDRRTVVGRVSLKSIVISLVYEKLMVRKDDLHHWIKSSTTGPGTGSSWVRRDTITESSANFTMWRFSCKLRHALVYKTNNRGERTHPFPLLVVTSYMSCRQPQREKKMWFLNVGSKSKKSSEKQIHCTVKYRYLKNLLKYSNKVFLLCYLPPLVYR